MRPGAIRIGIEGHERIGGARENQGQRIGHHEEGGGSAIQAEAIINLVRKRARR